MKNLHFGILAVASLLFSLGALAGEKGPSLKMLTYPWSVLEDVPHQPGIQITREMYLVHPLQLSFMYDFSTDRGPASESDLESLPVYHLEPLHLASFDYSDWPTGRVSFAK
jgi:hypothetical protein